MTVRRSVVLAALGVLLLAAAYSLYWMHAAGQARDGLEAWAQARRDQGWTVQWQDVSSRGFPLALTLEVAQPALTLPSGLDWRGEALTLSPSPLHPASAQISTRGLQTLRWHDADWSFTVEAIALRLSGQNLDAHAHGLRRDQGWSVADLAISVAPLPPVHGKTPPATWRFAASARDLEVHGLALDGFAPGPALVELGGRVMGQVPDAAPLAAIMAWSRQGGTVELDRVALDWPPLGLEGDGTAALDPQGQPLIALATRIRGFDALMDRLGETGLIDARAVPAAKTLLALMSKPDSRGRPAIAAPITVQDGALYLGPARMAPVPALPWGGFVRP